MPERGLQRTRAEVARERHVCDARSVAARVVHALHDRGGRETHGIAGPERHDPHVLRDAGDTDAVVALGTDRARSVHPMAVVEDARVGRVVVRRERRNRSSLPPDGVPTTRVVDIAVVVVVDAVPGDLARVGPCDRPEVGIIEPVPGVDVCHHDRRIADRSIPRKNRVGVGTRQTAGDPADILADVPQTPQLPEQRIVRDGLGLHVPVALSALHRRVAAERGDRGRDGLPGLRPDHWNCSRPRPLSATACATGRACGGAQGPWPRAIPAGQAAGRAIRRGHDRRAQPRPVGAKR